MLMHFNIQVIVLAAQATWRRSLRPALLQDFVIFPFLGILGVILLWWILSLFNEILPTPWDAFVANLDFITHPFYRRGPGDVGIGWLLLASLRRVFL